jgi:hypothetical protein
MILCGCKLSPNVSFAPNAEVTAQSPMFDPSPTKQCRATRLLEPPHTSGAGVLDSPQSGGGIRRWCLLHDKTGHPSKGLNHKDKTLID